MIIINTFENNRNGLIIGGRAINNIRFTDDTALIDTSKQSMENMFKKLANESESFNMAINGKKTKAMIVSKNINSLDLQMEGDDIEVVQEFKYLGAVKTSNGDCTTEIKRRIAMAKDKVTRLMKIWKARNLPAPLKVRLMKALVWSVFLYGAESWTIKESDRNRITSFEMWCWRKMLGVSWWERRSDISILEELGLKRDLMGMVARLKLQYFGHVARGSAGELALIVMEGDVEGSRRRGAPRKQWLDNIKEWSRRSYQECKQLAQDRTRWRRMSWKWSMVVAEPQKRMVPQ